MHWRDGRSVDARHNNTVTRGLDDDDERHFRF